MLGSTGKTADLQGRLELKSPVDPNLSEPPRARACARGVWRAWVNWDANSPQTLVATGDSQLTQAWVNWANWGRLLGLLKQLGELVREGRVRRQELEQVRRCALPRSPVPDRIDHILRPEVRDVAGGRGEIAVTELTLNQGHGLVLASELERVGVPQT